MCRFFTATLCLAFLGGCYSFKPVDVHVRDAETGLPIDRARVCVEHSHKTFFTERPETRCVSATLGTARVSAELSHGPIARVTARDYLPGYAEILEPSPRPRPRWLEETVDLYRQPAPSALITLPAGYRGLVKIAVRWPEFRGGKALASASYAPGQRLFPMPLRSPASVNWFDYSPLIKMALAENRYAVYDDGAPVLTASRDRPESVAIRPLAFGSPRGRVGWGTIYLFFVGTVAEWEPVRAEIDRRGSEIDAEWMERFTIPAVTS